MSAQLQVLCLGTVSVNCQFHYSGQNKMAFDKKKFDDYYCIFSDTSTIIQTGTANYIKRIKASLNCTYQQFNTLNGII